MALTDFFWNLRTAARLVTPNVVADSQRIDSDQIRRGLARAAIWLTPHSVQGFDPEDFGFLPEAERKALLNAVDTFCAVAQQVPSDGPATLEQIEAALPAFHDIIEIIRPDRFADPDAFVIGTRIEERIRSRLPSVVRELRFETGTDVAGAPAVWVWVVLDDEATPRERLLPSTAEVRRLIMEAVRDLGIQHWPYVRFRTDSELEPLSESAVR